MKHNEMSDLYCWTWKWNWLMVKTW